MGGSTTYGGLHFSIAMRDGDVRDANRRRIASEADWRAALARVLADSNTASQAAWRTFLHSNVLYYGSHGTRHMVPNAPDSWVRGLFFRSRNPMQTHRVGVASHFSLYGSQHQVQVRRGPVGLLEKQLAEQVLTTLRSDATRWFLVLSVEMERPNEYHGMTYEFCWQTAQELPQSM